MADYGMKVSGALGNKQIDSDYSNMIVVQSGNNIPVSNHYSAMVPLHPWLGGTRTRAAFDASGGGCDNKCLPSTAVANSRYWNALITLDTPTTMQPIIAIRPHSSSSWGVTQAKAIDSTGNGYFDKVEIVGGIDINTLTRTNYTTGVVAYFDYVIFSYPQGLTKSSEDYGMRLYNSSGGLTYDTGYDYMKILRTTTVPYTGAKVVSFPHTSSSSYYLADYFHHYQYAGVTNWACGGGVYDHYVYHYFGTRVIRKDSSGNMTLDLSQYAYMFGCVGFDHLEDQTQHVITEIDIT